MSTPAFLKNKQSVFPFLIQRPLGVFTKSGVESKSHIMDVYDEASHNPALLEAFRTHGKTYNRTPYSDSWGSFISAYAPFYNKNGEFVGIAGIDLDAQEFAGKQSSLYEIEGVCNSYWPFYFTGICPFLVPEKQEN